MELKRLVVALVWVSVVAAAVNAGQRVEWSQRWTSLVKETQSLLEAGEAKRARRLLVPLLREVVEAERPSDDADARLAQVLTQLALAEAGDGATDEALWHWHIAQNVDRAVASSDLSGYGNLGAALSANLLPAAPEKCAQPPGASSSPTIRKRREPKYPKAAYTAASGGILIIQVEVDAQGRPVRPQLLRRQPGALVYSAMEALRDWRFKIKPNGGDVPVCVVFKFG